MLQIFHFILDHRVGGPHIYVQTLATALGALAKSTLVTAGKGPATDLALVNLRHRHLALYPIEVACNVLLVAWRFRSKEARRNCVFDVHGAANVAPLMVARLLSIPVVWHFHETLGSFRNLARLGRFILRGARYRYVVVAKAAIDAFALKDAVLIPGAIDTEFWRIHEAAIGPRARDGALRLVTVGNLNPLKGGDLLLDALAGFPQPWELVVVGAELATYRDFSAQLHGKAEALGRGIGRVRFAGWQPAAAVRALLAATDVFVLPSRSEACPIALLEAMAMERACVATDVGDVPVIIPGPEFGIVAPRESVDSLRAALERAAAIGDVGRREMGVRARQSIVRGYSRNEMAMRHMDVYEKLVREPVGGC